MEKNERRISMTLSKLPLHMLPPEERDKYCYTHFKCSFEEYYKMLKETDNTTKKHSE